MSYYRSKTLLFNVGCALPLACGAILFNTTSCSSDFSFSWTGAGGEFERNYTQFGSTTIEANNVFNSYVHKNNFNLMFCQDVIYKMNFDWKKWPSSAKLTYVMTASSNGNRLSWDLKVHNEAKQMLLWWTIRNLQYEWKVNPSDINKSIQIVPTNVDITKWQVTEYFWNDSQFDIVVKYRVSADDPFDSYEFSFKTLLPTEREAINDLIEFMSVTPFFYENVEVEDI